MVEHKTSSGLTVSELAEHLGAELIGECAELITAVNALDRACECEVSFISSEKYAGNCDESKAGAIIVAKKIEGVSVAQLVVENVDIALIKTLNLFAPKLTAASGIHPTAVIEESAQIAEDAAVGPGTYIGHNAKVGAGSIISAGCCVGENSTIGENSRLGCNAVIHHNCSIGNNCVIQANATIGSTGFGYSLIEGSHQLIPHNGGVIIEDCVDIGANTCVDRAKFGNTIIGAGTKVDNLVQIAHNCVLGKCCLIIAQVAMAGSSTLGNGVVMAGHAGIASHCKVGDGAIITAKSAALKDVAPGQVVSGMPARDIKETMRERAAVKRLPKMAKQLKELAKKVKELETAKDNK